MFILSGFYCHVSAALLYPPCPPCSRPGACLPPWGGRQACLVWRRLTAAGKRILRPCWRTASGPSRLWTNPPTPPEREGGNQGQRQKKSKGHVPHPIHCSVSGLNKTFLLISILVHINFPVFSGKLMNINACTFIQGHSLGCKNFSIKLTCCLDQGDTVLIIYSKFYSS